MDQAIGANMGKLIIVVGLLMLRLPTWVSAFWYLGRRTKLDGNTLDAKVQLICSIVERVRSVPVSELTPEMSREQLATFSRLLGGGPSQVGDATDMTVPGPTGDMPARLYRPKTAGPGPLPILVFYHGGGWIQGDIETHDEPCRLIANISGGLVLSVYYRLAPEHKFPAGVDDCLAAFRWVRDHGSEIGADPARIAVGGDSAGGNLAIVVCDELIKQTETGPGFQLLIYPATDSRLATRSFKLFEDGFFLTRERIDWYLQLYLADFENQKEDTRFAPVFIKDVSAHPPALIITAGFDPLRDEGHAWHETLQAAGVVSEYVQFDGMIHAFINMAGVLPDGGAALDLCGQRLKAVWN
jgi:acetyl esterase